MSARHGLSQIVSCMCGCGTLFASRNAKGRLRRFVRGHTGACRPKLDAKNPRRKAGEPNPQIECGCGCGVVMLQFDASGRQRRFVSGHHMAKQEVKAPRPPLTAARLRELLSYDPKTGAFHRLPGTGTSKPGLIEVTPKSSGYIFFWVDGRRYYAHRLAWLYMTGSWPKIDVDHKDGVGSHNWFSNLREATESQNGANRGKPAHNRSGMKGVRWDKKRGKWVASIKCNRVEQALGAFDDPAEASLAYQTKARELFGEFARHE